MSSLSGKQKLSLVALLLGAVVFVGALAQLNAFDAQPTPTAREAIETTRDCIQDAKTDADIDQCNNRDGGNHPWYEQHAVLAALAAGGVTFFVIAGGGRLLMK